MKEAKLWKQILHQGVQCRGEDKSDLDRICHNVLCSPIIVDSRPRDEDKEEGSAWNWGRFKGISFPFEIGWIEGHTIQGNRFGVYYEVNNQDDARSVSASFMHTYDGSNPCLMAICSIVFDLNGNLDTKMLDQNQVEAWFPERIRIAIGQELCVNAAMTALVNFLETILVLSCKNVSLQPHQTDPKQARIAAKRHGGSPDDYRYHTLVVRPPGAKSNTPPQDIGTMPRHMCRGHFSEYGPEFGKGLLFGKYAGRFYIPPHLKGNADNGTVEKDYKIV